ncbi:MAG: hypothetical protein ABI172_07260 [Ginsengibacter sp.]
MNNNCAKSKRVLYIGPIFFHYDKRIVKKIQELKWDIDAFEIYPHINNIYFKIINKLNLSNVEESNRAYFNKILLKKNYDYVLVRHAQQLSVDFLKKLKDNNPNAKFVNFNWDSIRPEYDYLNTLDYYDKIYSFDYKDCQKHEKISYLPLFFVDEYLDFSKNSNNNLKQEFDLLFVGAWRDKERYQLIKATQKLCKQDGLNFHYYLHFSYKAQFDSLKRGVTAKEARNKSLSHKDILKLFSVSNTIIDFPSSFQTGLTMRTFETLGSGKKLITTNKNILTEPFYDPEYISVIDKNNLNLNIDFIKNVPNHPIQNKMENYSIENYVNKLLL